MTELTLATEKMKAEKKVNELSAKQLMKDLIILIMLTFMKREYVKIYFQMS